MSSVSVTGNEWIFKKFDQNKILYLKDNFFLDEIIAKLLTIRNIENLTKVSPEAGIGCS